MPAFPTEYQAPEFSLTAAVRNHLGLSTRQMGRYLGVFTGFVSHMEAGRRGLSSVRIPRLLWRTTLLPAPLGQGAPAGPEPDRYYYPSVPLPAPDPLLVEWPASAPAPNIEALRRRLRDCRLLLLTHGQELARLQARAARLARRRWGLAQLQAAPAPRTPPRPRTVPTA